MRLLAFALVLAAVVTGLYGFLDGLEPRVQLAALVLFGAWALASLLWLSWATVEGRRSTGEVVRLSLAAHVPIYFIVGLLQLATVVPAPALMFVGAGLVFVAALGARVVRAIAA